MWLSGKQKLVLESKASRFVYHHESLLGGNLFELNAYVIYGGGAGNPMHNKYASVSRMRIGWKMSCKHTFGNFHDYFQISQTVRTTQNSNYNVFKTTEVKTGIDKEIILSYKKGPYLWNTLLDNATKSILSLDQLKTKVKLLMNENEITFF